MKEQDCPTARCIVEEIERNGGGKIDRGVWRKAIEQGFKPIDDKVHT